MRVDDSLDLITMLLDSVYRAQPDNLLPLAEHCAALAGGLAACSDLSPEDAARLIAKAAEHGRTVQLDTLSGIFRRAWHSAAES